MVCSECKREKSSSDFYVDRLKPRGRVSRCKSCYAEKQKKTRLGPRRRFQEARQNAIRRGYDWQLTYDQFLRWIWGASCFYCGSSEGINGIDRLNNEPYYSMANAVSCCFTCNGMKSKMTMRQFFNQVQKIANHLELEKSVDDFLREIANASIALDGKY